MKDSLVHRQSRISTRGFIQIDHESFEVPPKPGTTPVSAAWKTIPPLPFQPVAERFPALEKQEIIFSLIAPAATQVNVAGNFNCWRADASPLKNTGDGKWVTRMMLTSGQYEYRFVVDGLWSDDPCASQRAANPYGGFNSVIIVPLAVKTSIL